MMNLAEAQNDEFAEEQLDGEAYVRFDIATYPSDKTLSVLFEEWKSGDIVIPDFQRAYVWKQTQASLLIESFLLGLPVPPVFFYVDQDNKSLVIDGQQRITSIAYFLDGYFGNEDKSGDRRVFRLSGLSPNSPFTNRAFKELTEADQRKLRNSVLRAINIRQLSPDGDASSVYYIFERLNTGGTPLKPQEIRNCVFRGPIVSHLRDLNKNPAWRALLGNTEVDKHERDTELVLRLFALFANGEKYAKPMKAFLNNVMREHRNFDTEIAREFQKSFVLVANAMNEANLGRRPFSYGGPLNSSMLEAVFWSCLERAGQLKTDFTNRFQELKADRRFREYVSSATTDVTPLRERKEIADKILFDD